MGQNRHVIMEMFKWNMHNKRKMCDGRERAMIKFMNPHATPWYNSASKGAKHIIELFISCTKGIGKSYYFQNSYNVFTGCYKFFVAGMIYLWNKALEMERWDLEMKQWGAI